MVETATITRWYPWWEVGLRPMPWREHSLFKENPAHLVTITIPAEQDFVESLLPGDQPFSANYWIGLTDRDTQLCIFPRTQSLK